VVGINYDAARPVWFAISTTPFAVAPARRARPDRTPKCFAIGE